MALVETAIVLPVLLLIVFGVFELGMMYRSATVASSASRSGVRLASATYAPAPNGPRVADTTTTRLEIADLVAQAVAETLRDRTPNDTPLQLRIYRADAGGLPVGGDFTTCPTDCVRYAWNGSAWAYSGGAWTAPDACGVTVQSVGVWVSVDHEPVSQLLPLGSTMRERSVMRLEPRPSAQCPGPGGES